MNRFFIVFLFSLVTFSLSCFGIERPEQEFPGKIGIFTKLGTQVDVSTPLTDEFGHAFVMSDLLKDGKPLVVLPVYYKCPRLCGLLLDGVIKLANAVPLHLKKDYNILAISFNPEETVDDARIKGEKFREQLSDKSSDSRDGLVFSVGEPGRVAKVMDQLGFKYKPDGKDFAHSAGLMILTPKGEVSQLFTGIEFSPWDVRLALVEASKGAIGTAIDHFLLYCFRFDPLLGKYTWAVFGVMRIGGVLTLLVLAAVYYLFVIKKTRMRGPKDRREV